MKVNRSVPSATVIPVLDYMYGERQYGAEDFAGHRWTFTETLADVDPQTWGGQYLDPD
jgi:hypothetical protein